eukprot:6785215-Pyramimonas_sp.AAC.1
MHKASLSEAVAAGCLSLAGWPPLDPTSRGWRKGEEPPPVILLDPMCGSGTVLVEAALMAMGAAP